MQGTCCIRWTPHFACHSICGILRGGGSEGAAGKPLAFKKRKRQTLGVDHVLKAFGVIWLWTTTTPHSPDPFPECGCSRIRCRRGTCSTRDSNTHEIEIGEGTPARSSSFYLSISKLLYDGQSKRRPSMGADVQAALAAEQDQMLQQSRSRVAANEGSTLR